MFSLLKLTLLSSQTERLWHYYLLSKKFIPLKKNKKKKVRNSLKTREQSKIQQLELPQSPS